MNKRRPVIVLSYSRARPGLAIVVPLSTTAPHPMQKWHYLLSEDAQWDRRERWVKGDMIYAVALDRLFRWRTGRKSSGDHQFLQNFRISETEFTDIQDAVLAALKITRP